MKKHLILLSLLYCTVGYGQEKKDTIYFQDKVVPKGKDAVSGKVIYGLAGIQFDSARYYFRKYLNLRDKGVVDSLNPFKQKLINYNKK